MSAVSFARRLAAASWGSLVSAVIVMLAVRFYTAELSPEAFGLAMLGLTTLNLVDTLGPLTFGQALAQVLKDGDCPDRRRGAALALGLRLSAWFGLLTGLSLIAAGLVFGWLAAIVLAALAVPFCLLEGPRTAGQTLAMLDRRWTLVSAWNACDALGTLVCTVAIIRFTEGDAAALIAGAVVSRILVGPVFSRLALGPIGSWRADHEAAAELLPRALAFGSALALAAPIGWLSASADRYIVGVTAGLAPAGILSALAGVIARPYSVLSSGLTNLYRPDLLDQAAGRQPVHPRPLLSWLRAAVFFGACGVIGAMLFGKAITDFLIRFHTPGIDEGELLTIIAVSQVFMLATHAFENRLLALGASRRLVAGHAVCVIVGLPLIYVGAMTYGLIGAAWGRVANELLKLCSAATLVALHRRRQTRMTAT